jgi:hypothetical protein
VNGEDYRPERIVEFSIQDLDEEARKAWLQLYGTTDNERLHSYRIREGQIYEDGSVDKHEPYIDWFTNDWLEQDAVLTPETVGDAVLKALEAYRKVEAELAEYKPKWAEARAKYEKKLEERQKQEQAKAEAEELMQPTIEKLEKRISQLEGYLKALIKASANEALEEAGLIAKRVGYGEDDEELTAEQQEALETADLDC